MSENYEKQIILKYNYDLKSKKGWKKLEIYVDIGENNKTWEEIRNVHEAFGKFIEEKSKPKNFTLVLSARYENSIKKRKREENKNELN